MGIAQMGGFPKLFRTFFLLFCHLVGPPLQDLVVQKQPASCPEHLDAAHKQLAAFPEPSLGHLTYFCRPWFVIYKLQAGIVGIYCLAACCWHSEARSSAITSFLHGSTAVWLPLQAWGLCQCKGCSITAVQHQHRKKCYEYRSRQEMHALVFLEHMFVPCRSPQRPGFLSATFLGLLL